MSKALKNLMQLEKVLLDYLHFVRKMGYQKVAPARVALYTLLGCPVKTSFLLYSISGPTQCLCCLGLKVRTIVNLLPLRRLGPQVQFWKSLKLKFGIFRLCFRYILKVTRIDLFAPFSLLNLQLFRIKNLSTLKCCELMPRHCITGLKGQAQYKSHWIFKSRAL